MVRFAKLNVQEGQLPWYIPETREWYTIDPRMHCGQKGVCQKFIKDTLLEIQFLTDGEHNFPVG